jgi:hypothetical protein
MRAMLVLLGLFCIVALGCATTTEEKTLTSGPPADVAGTWTGYAGTGTSTASVRLTLDQKGTDLTGDISIGSFRHMSGSVTGTVTGASVKLSATTTTFEEWQVNQDTMTGYTPYLGYMRLRRSR